MNTNQEHRLRTNKNLPQLGLLVARFNAWFI